MKANVFAAILAVVLARDNSDDEVAFQATWTSTGNGFAMDGDSGEWMGKNNEGEWSLDHWFSFVTYGSNLPNRRWVINWVEWENSFVPGTMSSLTCAAKFVVNQDRRIFNAPAAEYELTNWTGSFTSGDATV